MPTERRGATRYPINLEIRVNEGSGIVRNLSSSGVFFETDDELLPDEEVHLVFPFEHAAPSGTRARCSARIIRVERVGLRFGVAASYQTTAFDVP